MRKIAYNPPIPKSGQSLLGDFADVKLINRIADIAQNAAAQVFLVGTEDGTVEVPFKPGFIYIRAMYPDETYTLSQCYVPTYEDGSTKVLFEAGQVIKPTRTSDTNPTYYIYEGIPPTPKQTQSMYLADDFDTTGVSSTAFNADGSLSGNDDTLPNRITVNGSQAGKDPAQVLSWEAVDSGERDVASGERLWYVNYTGQDFGTGLVDPGYYQTQADGSNTYVPPAAAKSSPPSGNQTLTNLFDPCDPEKPKTVPTRQLPIKKPLPPLQVKVRPPAATPRKPDDKDKNNPNRNPLKYPPSGFRLPPNTSPGVKPPTKPYVPPPIVVPPNPPGPPTGPGKPPPSPPNGGPGGGGTWHDDGEFVDGCFGVPFMLDAQIVVSNDNSSPSTTSSTLTRVYYDIRSQIDTAIQTLVNDGSFRSKDLISVSLMFDGINEESVTTTIAGHEGAPTVATREYVIPRVYRTKTNTGEAIDTAFYFAGPIALTNTDIPTLPPQTVHVGFPPDMAIDSKYRVWDFDTITIGTDMDPINCDPLHYTYAMNTLPAYTADLLELLADHPGYRLYLSCFKYKKYNGTPLTLPYSHDFGSGDADGWTGNIELSPVGNMISSSGLGAPIFNPGPFTVGNWVKGWNVTIEGWNDRASDFFFNIHLDAGIFTFDAYVGDEVHIATGSKNMYPPYETDYWKAHPLKYTFTVPNIDNKVYSLCEDYYFRINGSNTIQGIHVKQLVIEPIYGEAPKPVTAPPPTGPGGGTGGGSGPTAPSNGGPTTIPKGTPVGPPYNPAAGGGDDGNAKPNQKPANGGATDTSPAVGVAPEDVPPGGPINAQSSGKQGGYAGLTPNKPVYLDASAPGGVTQTKPTCSGCLVQQLGTATDTTTIDIDIGEATKLL